MPPFDRPGVTAPAPAPTGRTFELPVTPPSTPSSRLSAADLTKPSRGRRGMVIAVIASVIVLALGGSAAGILLTRSTSSKVTPPTATTPSASTVNTPRATPAPRTIAYTDPDQYYTAQFDRAPTYHSTTQSTAAGSIPYRYAEYDGHDCGCSYSAADQLVGVLVFTPGTTFDPERGLRGIAAAGKGSVVSSTPSTFQGYPSLEGVVSLPGSFLKVQLVHVGSLTYIIGTAGPVNPPSDYAGFVATVHLTPH